MTKIKFQILGNREFLSKIKFGIFGIENPVGRFVQLTIYRPVPKVALCPD